MPKNIAGNESASILFPEYTTLYKLIEEEVKTLNSNQLDWTSGEFGWSEWSIRRQIGHMTSLLYRWMFIRCGKLLDPNKTHKIDHLEALAMSSYDRTVDEKLFADFNLLLSKLKECIALASKILKNHTVHYMKNETVEYNLGPHWSIMIKAHPTGFKFSQDPSQGKMSLEAVFRHMYFEEITHLYNIQRLKRAQRISTISNVPKVGYWTLEEWDRSEPI